MDDQTKDTTLLVISEMKGLVLPSLQFRVFFIDDAAFFDEVFTDNRIYIGNHDFPITLKLVSWVHVFICLRWDKVTFIREVQSKCEIKNANDMSCYDFSSLLWSACTMAGICHSDF